MISLIVLAIFNAAPTVSLEHRGSLREGLQEIARKGGLNLVAIGSFDQEAQIHLKDLTAEEALTSVATAYGLQLVHQGNLWIIKPSSAGAVGPTAPIPPLPVAPAIPPLPVEQAQNSLAQAEAWAEEAQELREAALEEIEAAQEEARARIETAKANAESENDVVSMTGPVVIKEDQRVHSAISFGGSVTVQKNARVEGDVVSFGGDVILQQDARIDGDAVSFGGKVIKEEGAKVFGEEVSFGGAGLGSMMASKAAQVSRPQPHSSAHKRGSAVAGFFAQFAVLFGLGFLLMTLAPQRMKTVEAEIKRAPGLNGAVGFLGLACSIPLTLFLMITLIGIPVAMAFWMLAGVSTLIGLVAVANILGSRLPVPRLRRTQAIALAVGLLVMLLVARIPVLGPLCVSIAVLISLGAIIRTRIGQRGQGIPISTSTYIDSQPIG